MKKITDDDLMLLYYGEHEDPELAARVAGSEELSDRFSALCEELAQVELFVPPARGDDYGAEVWRRISPRLDNEQETAARGWRTWMNAFRQPKFSLAGALSITVIVTLAFVLGRQGGHPGEALPFDPHSGLSATVGIDPEQLLTVSVSNHLEQLSLVLTQFANMPNSSADEAERATDMLVANRLYRQAAISRGDQRLAAFLAELEPLLIELAHEAYKTSPATRDRMQKEVRDSLLFRVRVMNKQLNNSLIST